MLSFRTMMPGSLWRPTLELHLTVKIFLLDEDQSDNGKLGQSRAIERTLREALPIYHAPVIPSVPAPKQPDSSVASKQMSYRSSSSSRLRVRYDVSYEVIHASEEFCEEYIHVLAEGARVNLEDGNRTWLLPTDAVSEAVEAMVMKESGLASESKEPTFANGEITILVANPSLTNKLSSRLGGVGENPKAGADDELEVPPNRFVGSNQVEQAAPSAEEHKDAGDVKERPSMCTTSWVRRGKIIFLDLGAIGCRHVHEITPIHSSAVGSEQVVSRPDGDGGAREPTTFSNMVSSSVVSVMRPILAPAVPAVSAPGDIHDTVIVPLLVFRGAGLVNELGAGDAGPMEEGPLALEDVVNVTHLSRVLNTMALPGQEVVIVGAAHSLSEHPQVAVALEKSFATKRVLDVNLGRDMFHPQVEVLQGGYIDGDRLLREMRSAGDTLASSLLSDVRADSVHRLDLALAAGGRAQDLTWMSKTGARILPVFVFCLPGADEPLLATGTSFGSTTGDPRRNRPVSSFERGDHFWVEAGGDAVLVVRSKSGTSTQPVASGLLRALHGATAPDHFWSSESDGLVQDLAWARGYHPFAPFGFAGSTSEELFVDVTRRNAVASRAAAAAATLSEVAGKLEHFAESSLLSDLSAGRRVNLYRDGAATEEAWGHAFEEAVTFRGFPADAVLRVVSVHKSLRELVVSFEAELQKISGATLTDAMEAMDASWSGALAFRERAVQATNELQWCDCTFSHSSSASHTPWILFLAFMSIGLVLYGLTRVVSAGRRALLKYVGSSSPGPESYM